MKRIFMCINYPLYNPAIGISKKLRAQIETFSNMGYEVTYTAYTEKGIAIIVEGNTVKEYTYPSYISPKLYGILRKFKWLKSTCDYLNETDNTYDLGFIRWGAVDNSFLGTLSLLKIRCSKIIMDCHGYHTNYKGKTLKGHYIELTTKKNCGKLSQYVDICMTETKERQIFNIQAIPMDTGIDVGKYPQHVYSGKDDEIHMISVANEQPYHGYDRIIKSLYKTKEKVFLHLVGKMNPSTFKLVKRLGLQNRVFFHGYQSGENLMKIYNACNVGVGPLAPHRIGGKEGTGIKTKEYFAIGLPYFYAGKELLVPDDYPYVLRIIDDESLIDIKSIVDFYNKIKSISGLQEDMRQFARNNYSWEKIFRRVLESIGEE